MVFFFFCFLFLLLPPIPSLSTPSASSPCPGSSPPLHFYPGTLCCHETGQQDPNNSTSWVVTVSDPSHAWMTYGPYTNEISNIPQRVDFVLEIGNNSLDNAEILILDVFDYENLEVLAERVIHRRDFVGSFTPQVFSLDFTNVDCSRIMEFRVFYVCCATVIHRDTVIFAPLTKFRWEYVIVDGTVSGLSQRALDSPSKIVPVYEPQYPGARCAVGLTSLGDDIYLFGGHVLVPIPDILSDLWIFSTVTNRWTFLDDGTGTGSPSARYYPSLLSTEDQESGLYLFAGSGENSEGSWGNLQDIWFYDPLANPRWSFVAGIASDLLWINQPSSDTVPYYPGGRHCIQAWTVDMNYYTWGGWDGNNNLGDPFYAWNHETRSWSISSSGSSPSVRHAAATWMLRNGSSNRPLLYLFGGGQYVEGGPHVLFSELYFYDLWNEDWIFVSGMTANLGIYQTDGLGFPGARWKFGGVGFQSLDRRSFAVIVGGLGYGSSGGVGFLGDTFWLDIAGNKWYWADVRLDEAESSDVRLFGAEFDMHPKRPGQRYHTDVTYHAKTQTLYYFGGVAAPSVHRMDLWRMKLLCDHLDVPDDKRSCSERGSCFPLSENEIDCECEDVTAWSGPNCAFPVCFGESALSNLACDGHGDCISRNNCTCEEDFTGSSCNMTHCFGAPRGNPDACGGLDHGDCVGLDRCVCYPSWSGIECATPACDGIVWSNETVCAGRGSCSDGVCSCDGGYLSDSFCSSKVTCFMTEFDLKTVCSGNGVCLGTDICDCQDHWHGEECSIPSCFGNLANETTVCGGHGDCVRPELCFCAPGFQLPECTAKPLLSLTATVLVSVLSIVLFLFFLVLLVALLCFIVRKKADRRDLSRHLSLPLLDGVGGEPIQTLRPPEFEDTINPADVKFIHLIASGGSGSSIYISDWCGTTVAAKVMHLHASTTQDSVNALVAEASLMKTLRHPNILRLFGLCLSLPRIAIILEYCSLGDVRNAIVQREKTGSPFSMSQRLRWVKEIASGMAYLHASPRCIMHRDLKCENVLLDQGLVARIADFGLSRAIDDVQQTTRTKGIGTTSYMAPEMILGEEEYGLAIDVFAFAVLSFMILSGDFLPYRHVTGLVEYKIANDPTCRPDLSNLPTSVEDEEDEGASGVLQMIRNLLSRCWDHNVNVRPSFKEIQEILASGGEDSEISFKEIQDSLSKSSKSTKIAFADDQ